MVTGSVRCVSANLGRFRPSRLASAGALGPAFGLVSTAHHVHMSAVITLRDSILCVALAAHVRSGTCAMLALLDSVLNTYPTLTSLSVPTCTIMQFLPIALISSYDH